MIKGDELIIASQKENAMRLKKECFNRSVYTVGAFSFVSSGGYDLGPLLFMDALCQLGTLIERALMGGNLDQ